MNDDVDLAALLCSRLCHDLISPVGAVGNGVELLEGAPGVDPEIFGLLNDSARKALAVLGFYRIAFGAAGGDGAALSAGELRQLAQALLADTRHSLDWPVEGDDLQRREAKLLLLMILTAASASPLGADIALPPAQSAPLTLSVSVRGRRVALTPEARAILTGASDAPAPAPRDAHLTLLARHAAAIGVTIRLDEDQDFVAIRAMEWAD
jgi:histidine phosphotransferase ChpT